MASEESQGIVSHQPFREPLAWQPFTPRGISAFAFATTARLLLVQVITALICTAAVFWFLAAIWFPAFKETFRRLPDQGTISSGELNWPRHSFEVLHERRPFLVFIVDLQNQSQGHSADVTVKLHRRTVQVCSPLGCVLWYYPREHHIEFNRRELESWWGAWEPIILGWVAVGVPLTLLCLWALLATLYFLPCRLLAFYVNRGVSLGGCWRLCSAALMPGALLFMATLVLYGTGVLDLIHLLVMSVLHVVAGWIFLVLATLKLPGLRTAIPLPANPFAPTSDTGPAPGAPEAEDTPPQID